MFRIAICDDEPIICSQIERIILDHGRKISNNIEVDVYFSGEELYRFLKDGNYYDMIFLDIELKKLNGIDVGKKIRNEMKNEAVLIVYISGRESYAMDLFEVRPMHFLVKPIRTERIFTVLQKGMELSNQLCQTFEYKEGQHIRKIEVKNILYFESIDRKIKMITLAGEKMFYGTLADIFTEVEKNGFFFCHKSYLVNYHHVTKFEYKKLMINDNVILPISQAKRKGIREMQIRLEMERGLQHRLFLKGDENEY